MTDELLNLANIYLSFPTYDSYLQFYDESKNIFKDLANSFYGKFVLLPTSLDDRWIAYSDTPSEWLEDESYMTQYLTAKFTNEKDEDEVEFSHFLFELYQERNKTLNHRGIVGCIDELVAQLEDGDKVDFQYWSKSQSEYAKTDLTIDMVNQWKQALITYRVGSITLDW